MWQWESNSIVNGSFLVGKRWHREAARIQSTDVRQQKKNEVSQLPNSKLRTAWFNSNKHRAELRKRMPLRTSCSERRSVPQTQSPGNNQPVVQRLKILTKFNSVYSRKTKQTTERRHREENQNSFKVRTTKQQKVL